MENEELLCPLCLHPFQKGASRCRGCRGHIVYGATEAELKEARELGIVMVGVGAVLLFTLAPGLANGAFGWNIPIGLGLGYWSLLVALLSALLGGVYAKAHRAAAMRELIRVFDQP